jgi:hypothetical protein
MVGDKPNKVNEPVVRLCGLMELIPICLPGSSMPDPQSLRAFGRKDVGQAFQPDVRLESLTYASFFPAALRVGDLVRFSALPEEQGR